MNSSWNLTGMSSNGFSVFETILHFLFLPVICLAGYHSACNINTYIEPWYANTYPIAAACLSICTSTFLLNLCRQNYIYIKSEREHFLLACWCIAALIEFETILGLLKGKKNVWRPWKHRWHYQLSEMMWAEEKHQQTYSLPHNPAVFAS